MSLFQAFNRPTAGRFGVLLVGAILACGKRTVTAILRAVGSLANGHYSTYHRVFSRAPWSQWTLGWTLTRLTHVCQFVGGSGGRIRVFGLASGGEGLGGVRM